jgi:hypothetical protein
LCSGNLSSIDVSDSDGWIWVSDRCVIRLFDRAAAWADVVAGKWIAAWGDSTLKQPLANFLEYKLGVPVFQVDMEHLHLIKEDKGRPDFFSYRQYNIVRDPPVHAAVTKPVAVSYAWGGCPGTGAAPRCGKQMGTSNRLVLARYLGIKLHAKDATKHKQRGPLGKILPDVIILNHFIWRPPSALLNETEFLGAMHDTVQWLHAALREKIKTVGGSAADMPLLVWATGVRTVHGATTRRDRCSTSLPSNEC